MSRLLGHLGRAALQASKIEFFGKYPTLPQRELAHLEPVVEAEPEGARAVVGLESSTCPAIYYLGTIKKRTSTSQQPLAHFKTEGRPLLPLYRLGTNSQ